MTSTGEHAGSALPQTDSLDLNSLLQHSLSLPDSGVAVGPSPAALQLEDNVGLLGLQAALWTEGGHTFSQQHQQQPPQQPHQPPQEQPRRRGRGRQPIPEELLTEKQLRAREANKKFAQRQKARAREAEASLEAASAELERERAQHEREQLANSALASLLDYKEEALRVLTAASQANPLAGLGLSITPELVEVMQRERVMEEYSIDLLTKYAVAGHTDHIDSSSSRVREAPPFEAVARELADIVEELQRILEETRCAGAKASAASASSNTSASQPAAASAAGGGRDLEQCKGGAPSDSPCPAQEHSSEAALGGAEACSGAAGSSQTEPSGQQPEEQPSPREAPLADWSDDNPSELQLYGYPCGNKILLMEDLDKGLEVQHGDELYRFTGPQLRRTAMLLMQYGLVCFQQVILFPENTDKLFTHNLDNCTLGEEQDVERLRQVLRELQLRPSQLERMHARHKEYLSATHPVLEERRKALEQLRELHSAPVPPGASQQEHASHTLAVSKCCAVLQRSARAMYAATMGFMTGVSHMFEFPVQEIKLVTLPWPRLPMLHLCGMAAAMELGLEAPALP